MSYHSTKRKKRKHGVSTKPKVTKKSLRGKLVGIFMVMSIILLSVYTLLFLASILTTFRDFSKNRELVNNSDSKYKVEEYKSLDNDSMEVTLFDGTKYTVKKTDIAIYIRMYSTDSPYLFSITTNPYMVLPTSGSLWFTNLTQLGMLQAYIPLTLSLLVLLIEFIICRKMGRREYSKFYSHPTYFRFIISIWLIGCVSFLLNYLLFSV